MSGAAHKDEVVEAARATRDLAVVICDLLSERRTGYLRTSAAAFVAGLGRPFPFFSERALSTPISTQVSSEDWGDALRDLHLVGDMLAIYIRFLDGTLVRLVIDAVHRDFPDLGREATEAHERARKDATEKAKSLVQWMDRIEARADELSGEEALESSIRESRTLEALRFDLGL